MSNKRKFQILIDLTMTILLPVLMAYSLVGEEPHEWVGVAMFVAFCLHTYMNRQWYKGLTKGKYNLVRKVQTAMNFMLAALMVAMIFSGILMSRYAFSFLSLNIGTSLARLVHLAASYWFFVLTALHLGMHWNNMMGIPKKMFKIKGKNRMRNILLKVITLIIIILGVHGFVTRNFFSYMFLRTHYAFFNFMEPLTGFFFEYLMIMGLFVAAGHYGFDALQKLAKKKRKKKK